MNALLISPAFPQSFWSLDHALAIVKRKSLLPPLGLLTVAAMMPPHWSRRLVDINIQPLTDQDLAWADCVFLGGLAIQWEDTAEIIRRCRAAGKKIIAGGPLFTAAYALFQDVDHFVLNEAELTLPPLLVDLETGSPRRTYRSRELADLRRTPCPQWDLADLRQYAVAGIQYSRGCPFDCDFCNITATLGRKTRVKDADQILRELDALYNAGWRDRIFFVDDNLIGNKHALREQLLPALTVWQRDHGYLPLCTQASMNLADDPRLARAMVDAGFDMIFVGIESPEAANLVECGKKQNRNRNMIADVKSLQRMGLEVQGGFIVGFDHDTPDTFQRQSDFIQESGIATAMVGQLQAAPGTRLKDRLAREGRLRGPALGHNTDGNTNFIPTMGLEPLRQGHARLLNQLYSPKMYYQRLKTFLREFPSPTRRRPFRREYLTALGRALKGFGIDGAQRWEFWKLLAWTLWHKPRLLALAVRLAAIGHHHRLMAGLLNPNEDPVESVTQISLPVSVSLAARG
jgi:radical SAM superfamily enzyme YgiQ (UPF0313 family)